MHSTYLVVVRKQLCWLSWHAAITPVCNVFLHVQVEGRNVGKVDTETYRIYARAWGAYYILPTLMLLLAVVERSFYGLQNWWLSVWSNSNAATVVSCTFALLQILPTHCQHSGHCIIAHCEVVCSNKPCHISFAMSAEEYGS